jgi:ribosomal protein S18 acetylase RimI-like enzyme
MSEPVVATLDDAPVVGSLIAAAFADDPVMSWVFAGPHAAAKLDVFFGFLTREAYVPLGAAYLNADACAVWTPPGSPPWPPDRGERFSAELKAVCDQDDFGRLRALNEATEAVHPREPHWYLSVLAVWPDRRGRGQGSALLADSLRIVDDASMPAYLESTNPRNIPLYERHGFVVTADVPISDGPSLTAMWRPAR